MGLTDELKKHAGEQLVPLIISTIAGLVKALQDLGAEVPDLVAACAAEEARIGAAQAANEAAAAAAMGLEPGPNKPPGA